MKTTLGITVRDVITGFTGTVTGRVTDQATQQPLSGAQVVLAGTTRGTITNDRGEYRLAGVPAGSVQIRVLRIGYAGATRTVAVTSGQTATADVALTATADEATQQEMPSVGSISATPATGISSSRNLRIRSTRKATS